MKRVWIVLLLLLGASPSLAHTRSESHAVWEIDGTDIDLILTFAEVDVAKIVSGDTAITDAALHIYLTERIYPLADGQRCALVPPGVTLSTVPGFRTYDFTYRCETPRNISIHFGAFFDKVPTHVNFAQIQNITAAAFTEQLLTIDRQDVAVTGEAEQLLHASFLDFMEMGVHHIFTGIDHMSFLLGLVLIARRLRDLVFVVTGFTLGHSLTLALAVTGVIRPHAEFIDALVALTIVLIGAENIVSSTRRPEVVAGAVALSLGLMAVLKLLGVGSLPLLLVLGAGVFSASYLQMSGHVRDAGRLRLAITLVFGLIHGFGFAKELLEMQLPPERLASLLVGFNLGVEVAQLALVLGASLLALIVIRL
ncbi:MAG: HupE/UreJ family protein, partial [Rhodospirillaceae bacterium]|nr:HupE/UreJ family protein [Rhodospirillaceae bacterium]